MNSFISSEEQKLTERFLRDGYVIKPAESRKDLALFRGQAELALGALDLDYTHDLIEPENLNALKLAFMQRLNDSDWARLAYFNLARELLSILIGNELAMQKKFNVNIQLPKDNKSLLPVHADTWTGDSPYQLVLWVPLVNCYRTKSMYILPPGEEYSLAGSSEEVFASIKDRVKWLDIKFGEVLIFNSTLPHGNRLNEEETTRWTINCRFKSIHSPWGVKGPGEHFEPITLRAASRIGMAYQYPAV